jgi:negative regulator of sigma E activity
MALSPAATLNRWCGNIIHPRILRGQKGETMRALAAALFGLTAAFLVGAIAVNSAVAQDKGGSTVKMKVLVDNDKVKAYEVTYAPGAENKGVASTTVRIVRALKGGTLERVYADGKKEKVVWQTGEVRQVTPGPAYTTKNIGKGELHLYVVQLK